MSHFSSTLSHYALFHALELDDLSPARAYHLPTPNSFSTKNPNTTTLPSTIPHPFFPPSSKRLPRQRQHQHRSNRVQQKRNRRRIRPSRRYRLRPRRHRSRPSKRQSGRQDRRKSPISISISPDPSRRLLRIPRHPITHWKSRLRITRSANRGMNGREGRKTRVPARERRADGNDRVAGGARRRGAKWLEGSC